MNITFDIDPIDWQKYFCWIANLLLHDESLLQIRRSSTKGMHIYGGKQSLLRYCSDGKRFYYIEKGLIFTFNSKNRNQVNRYEKDLFTRYLEYTNQDMWVKEELIYHET